MACGAAEGVVAAADRGVEGGDGGGGDDAVEGVRGCL